MKKITARRYRNRRIGEFFKELDMTEGRCTGIPKIYAAMKRNGSPRPKFTTDEGRFWFLVELPIHSDFGEVVTGEVTDHVTPQVTPQVVAILQATQEPLARDQLQAAAGIRDREHFRKQYLLPMLEAGWIEMTVPDKPRSSKQEYRLTPLGREVLRQRTAES